MTLKHLKIFTYVYQEMNITYAARKLHMTQPAVTRAIKEMENYYNVRLFDRINHKLSPTESGNELYAGALHIVDSFHNLERGLQNRDGSGLLHIGGSITLGNTFLPPVIAAFQAANPHLQIKVMVTNSAQLQNALLNNTIDLALMEGTVSSEYLTCELLNESHLTLVLPPGHPLRERDKICLNDLSQFPLLLREKGSSIRSFLEHIFASHGLNLNPLWESSSTQALIRAVSCGLGISILPEALAASAAASGMVCLHRLSEEQFVRHNYIVWHRQKYLTKSALNFMDACRIF